ncbi:MAG: glycosyl hydrolase 115 family protein, partial [Kiritimatiellae bacterium]|nr:glycosyl hydrolase 115 family protein [Kiritimatiellia bacterium]
MKMRFANIGFALGFAVYAYAGEAVKYRGIFINDEDWSLRPWAEKHFGKDEQIGVGAYEKIFALMEKNGLNLIWPAMHEGGYEFVSRPENMETAAKHGICVGTSHCEPMLRNNCYLSKADKKKWSWTKHKDFMQDYWQWAVDRYATNDVLWTIGMRGIHDGKMSDGNTVEEKIAVLEDVFAAQCAMLEKAGAGDAPKLFIPYKEVLPIFNAGLKVPKGTTIMWTNDNFGYIRRLGGPQCSGYGGGIYWHISYWGRPHGYLNICTTPPAFMWYELVAKCAANDTRDVWMVNAGDVFQAEILVYALGRFAADPDKWMEEEDVQEKILAGWVAQNFPSTDEAWQRGTVRLLGEYFNLGFIRKPEHMCVQWSENLPLNVKTALLERYKALIANYGVLEGAIDDPAVKDELYRTVGFQTLFLANAGIAHLENWQKERVLEVFEGLERRFDTIFGGEWSGFWPDVVNENTKNRWSTQMQWAWNEPPDGRKDYYATAYWGGGEEKPLKDAADFEKSAAANGGEWKAVKGLGTSNRAITLLPVKPGVGEGAEVEYVFEVEEGDNSRKSAKKDLILQFLPDFALWPGLGLGVEVQVNGGKWFYVEVPKHDSNIGEKDPR